jgi:hypothetical protein
MDLKLFVLGGGQRSETPPISTAQTNSFLAVTNARVPRTSGGRGRRKDREEVKMCRCCGIEGTFHLSPLALVVSTSTKTGFP